MFKLYLRQDSRSSLPQRVRRIAAGMKNCCCHWLDQITMPLGINHLYKCADGLDCWLVHRRLTEVQPLWFCIWFWTLVRAETAGPPAKPMICNDSSVSHKNVRSFCCFHWLIWGGSHACKGLLRVYLAQAETRDPVLLSRGPWCHSLGPEHCWLELTTQAGYVGETASVAHSRRSTDHDTNSP